MARVVLLVGYQEASLQTPGTIDVEEIMVGLFQKMESGRLRGGKCLEMFCFVCYMRLGKGPEGRIFTETKLKKNFESFELQLKSHTRPAL